jgi:hypothetical protein
MKNVVLAMLLAGVAGVAHANTKEACEAAHKQAVEAGQKELADHIEAALKAGNFADCAKAEAK